MTSSTSLSQSQAQFSAVCGSRAERLSPEGAGASGDSKCFTTKSDRTPDAARLCDECLARVLVLKEQALRVFKDGHFSASVRTHIIATDCDIIITISVFQTL